MIQDLLESTKSSFQNINLAQNYRYKGYEKNFNEHINLLVETSHTLNNSSIFSGTEFKVTNSLYWKTEAYILEQLDDVDDNEEVLDELDNMEDYLHEQIKVKLGKFYDNSSILKKMIDISVHNTLLSLKFDLFSRADEFKNPWECAKNILFQNSLIHTFSDEIADFKSFGLKLSEKESSISKANYIGILGKGYNRKFATGYIRDFIALRETLYQDLDDNLHTSSKPIKTESIIKKIRDFGISKDDLSDNQIKSFLIWPLKFSNRLGSNKEGYFVIKDYGDLSESYRSHFENFKGFYRTLERHRKLSKTMENVPIELRQHILFMEKCIEQLNKKEE